MSRKNSKITLRVQNKDGNSKHNIPKELIPITRIIENLNFVTESVGKSKWQIITTKYKEKIDVAGFDDLTKSFLINIYGRTYRQKFFVKVDIPKERCLLECKCIEMKIPVREREEDSYYYNQLKEFYEKKIVKTVEDFYK